MRRSTVLAFILVLAASNLMLVKPTWAQTTPSVPEFSLKIVEYPYDVAPTTTIDPYTGKTITTQIGYHVENKSIEVTIKNQAFNLHTDSNGNGIRLMYNIRWKGQLGDSWTYYAGQQNKQDYTRDFLTASNSEYSIWLGALSWSDWDKHPDSYNYFIGVPADGGQVDLQVEALAGYSTRVYVGDMIPLGAIFYYNFTGETSGWSSTQTITIPDTSTPSPTPTQTPAPSPSLTPSPSPSPSIPELPSWIIGLFAIAASAFLFVLKKRVKKN